MRADAIGTMRSPGIPCAQVSRSSDRSSLVLERRLAAAMVTAGLLSGSPASAQSELPTFRLEYTAEDSCPPAGDLADRLAARVGYSPVREGGTDLLEIRIEATSAGLAANLRWVDRAGAIVGERQLSGPAGRCDDLPEEQYRNTYYITPAVVLSGGDERPELPPDRAPAGTTVELDGVPIEGAVERVGSDEVLVVPVEGGAHRITGSSEFGAVLYGGAPTPRTPHRPASACAHSSDDEGEENAQGSIAWRHSSSEQGSTTEDAAPASGWDSRRTNIAAQRVQRMNVSAPRSGNSRSIFERLRGEGSLVPCLRTTS